VGLAEGHANKVYARFLFSPVSIVAMIAEQITSTGILHTAKFATALEVRTFAIFYV
jgi:hypothetical protein